MGEEKFFSVLVLAVLNILLLLMVTVTEPFYGLEFFMIILFVVGLFLVIISNLISKHLFGVTAMVFFAIGLLNTVFVYFFYISFGLVILTLINAFGFLIAIGEIGRTRVRPFPMPLMSKSDFIEKELPFEEPAKIEVYQAKKKTKKKAKKKKTVKKKSKKRGRPKKK